MRVIAKHPSENNILITSENLEKWGACKDFYNFFIGNHPSGEASLKAIVDELYFSNLFTYVHFLFKNIFEEYKDNKELLIKYKNFLNEYYKSKEITLEDYDETRKLIQKLNSRSLSKKTKDKQYFDIDEDHTKVINEIDNVEINTIGNSTNIINVGDNVSITLYKALNQVISTGNNIKVLFTETLNRIVLTGYDSRVTSKGPCSEIVALGDCSHIIVRDNFCRVIATGNNSKVIDTGDNTSILILGKRCVVTLGNQSYACFIFKKPKGWGFKIIYEGKGGIKKGVPYTMDHDGNIFEFDDELDSAGNNQVIVRR